MLRSPRCLFASETENDKKSLKFVLQYMFKEKYFFLPLAILFYSNVCEVCIIPL